MTRRLGVGIVGCGNISGTYLRLAPQFGAIEVRKVADALPEAAAARAKAFGVTATSVADLLAADDIDIVLNLTVPAAHFGVTKAALLAGKHVYTEKPLVLTMAEGDEIRRLTGETGLRVGSAPDTFLGGSHQLARAMIDGGRIGAVVSGTAHVMNHGMEHWHPNPGFFFLPGAGPILDLGPYFIAGLVQLLGPVRRVAALTGSATPVRTLLAEGPGRGRTIPVRTPTNIHALLDFVSGAAIALSASWDVWAHRHPVMELYGIEGSIFLPDPNFFGGPVAIAGRDGRVVEAGPSDHPFGRPNQTGHGGTPEANYRGVGLADMAAAILDGRPHRCALELALHVVEVMTGILKSGETGAFVGMATRCERPAPLDADEARSLLAATTETGDRAGAPIGARKGRSP